MPWIDPTNPHLGLKFDGRIAEDFKLATGTFVSVGPLRAKIINAARLRAGRGDHRPEPQRGRRPALPAPRDPQAGAAPAGGAPLKEVLESAAVQDHFQDVVDALAQQATAAAPTASPACT